MMKKGIWLFMACLLVFGLIYGVTWIGDAPVSAEISQEAKGQFVRVEDGGKKLVASYEGTEKTYPIADNVWVYRNSQKAGMSDLQKGDTLEIILNSKSQAAYIKAAGSDAAAAAASSPAAPAPSAPAAVESPAAQQPKATAQPGAAPSSGPAPAAQSASAQTPVPAPAPQPKAQSTAPGNTAAGGAWPWERLSLELKSRELMLKVKQEQKERGSETDIYVQTKDRAVIHLNGQEAEQMLRLLMAGLPTERAAWEKALKERLGAEFKLKDASPDWKLDIRWKDDAKQVIVPAAVQSSHSETKVKGYEKEKKEKEKENGKGKDEDKGKGKGKGHDDQDD